MKQIFSQKCAGYLMLNGVRLVRLETNLKDPRKHIFIFHDDERTRVLLDTYSKIANK